MAGLSNADPRHRLTVDAPSPPIPKDLQGSDSSMPLSPQWLLPKLGDEKIMPATGDPHIFVGKRSDSLKAVGNAEDLDLGEKKKDVFRPAFYGLENGRRDRWLDEEREASSAIRRDRWRDGEKDLNDSRKVERWSDTSKYPGESLRVPSDRWADSGNRDIAYEQRRESKWNTRWGPDDKESENWREKWSSRDGKGSPHLTTPGKEINSQDKDGNRDGESRFWRSSPSLYRAKGDSAPYLPSTLNKQMPIPGYGKGQGDNGQSVFPVGRGRVSLNSSSVTSGPFRQFALGTGSEMSNISDRDPFVLRYSRMKLLDIYRTMDLKVCRTSFEGFVEVPTLTQVEPLEPLSLTAPIAEESAILKAIDKGDIVSSGIPQALKDGSIGKSSIDLGMSSLNKSDVAAVMSDHRDDSTNNGKKEHSGYVGCTSYEKNAHGSDSKMAVSPSFHQSLDDKLIAEGTS
ncbi:hypothetical protein AXF42_Ash004248 [Apostasia shenzhenica]|uniref:Uncharacterized protein n=1 Tax=Apostasia shenzhenica TaxID=1088818 RepID=A0A2I0A2F4_9ASPA|nr:hypothetical protein AXF42_Ash004248 [Apostasia shenzhenica]